MTTTENRANASGSASLIDVAATVAGNIALEQLPYSLRLILENIIAHEDVPSRHFAAFTDWLAGSTDPRQVPFRPMRILSHDTAGIAMLVDLAALRDKIAEDGGDARNVNSAVPIDLVVDHSVSVDIASSSEARKANEQLELERNRERYRFLRWAEHAFENLRVVPPGNGICHQINMEMLATGVTAIRDGGAAIADNVIGTDSHTTMINALGILGWGVGGIEAEAVALGKPIMMRLPPVTGCRLTGKRHPTVTATDIALGVAARLRAFGVVGEVVEFFGEGLESLPMGDRAALANMAPEYGATCGLFPIDTETLRFYRMTGRDEGPIALIEAHARGLGLWRDDKAALPDYPRLIEIDLGEIVPLIAGPHRPQQLVPLAQAAESFHQAFPPVTDMAGKFIRAGDVAIASITSCTHTSNAHQMIAAGLIARNARQRGLSTKPWVKTSLSPGSRVVESYLAGSGLQESLDELGFHIAGFGCMTCAGNSGDLPPAIVDDIRTHQTPVCAVLSANRNFEGRTHPDIRACYLASPALVVAFALAGSVLIDLTADPLGIDAEGEPVMLRDIWPDESEVEALVSEHVDAGAYRKAYDPSRMNGGTWQEIDIPQGDLFAWDERSTFVRRPPFFGDTAVRARLHDISSARALAVLGDHITTDHISPFGRILPDSAAARHLDELGVGADAWSSYAERRGNHEVLQRSAFSNPRLKNSLADGRSGSYAPDRNGTLTSIFDAAESYKQAGIGTVIVAGKEYGTGSARDWAAKATYLLGVKAVIAESFERIHRANLVGLGVLPCQLPPDMRAQDLGIESGTEISIEGIEGLNGPRATVQLRLVQPDGTSRTLPLVCRLDTEAEVDEFRAGGLFAEAERTAAE
ncbi:aconitate hydratase AcnA [Sinorhizobium meliloti]|nr:aconitate hydratase AcnA [Sinorhizobium meliloti]